MPEHRLAEDLGEAAVGQVVGGVERAVAAGLDEHAGQPLLGAEVDGGRPPRWPCTTWAHSEPSSSSRVVPSRNTDDPSVRSPDGVRVETSSMTPSTPMTGVGWIATSPVWL